MVIRFCVLIFHYDHAEMARAVQMLSTACCTAQRERSALQQILEVKVQGMMGDMIEEEEAVAMVRQCFIDCTALMCVLPQPGECS